MIYNPLIDRVLSIAYEAHHGQKDKSGVPYIFHPYHLAEQMNTEDEVITALLHDVLEDTDVTAEELRMAGINDTVLEAVMLLTHDKSIDYMEYIERLKNNALARKVKMADLKHNSDTNRLEIDNEVTRTRRKKYARAIAILEEMENKDEI